MVLHAGPAMQDTVDFFSAWRCRLHIVDLFEELPLPPVHEREISLQQQFEEALVLPADTCFDICLFWDLFNFLDTEAMLALQASLRPHLGKHSRGHAFSVHNKRSAPSHHLYGIRTADTLSLRKRSKAPPGYAPHTQGQLKDALQCFNVERSVLLPDSRMELLMRARA